MRCWVARVASAACLAVVWCLRNGNKALSTVVTAVRNRYCWMASSIMLTRMRANTASTIFGLQHLNRAQILVPSLVLVDQPA
jgi:hypothetical protein